MVAGPHAETQQRAGGLLGGLQQRGERVAHLGEHDGVAVGMAGGGPHEEVTEGGDLHPLSLREGHGCLLLLLTVRVSRGRAGYGGSGERN